MVKADAQLSNWVPFTPGQIQQIKQLASLSIPKADTPDRSHWIELGRWDLAQKICQLNDKWAQAQKGKVIR